MRLNKTRSPFGFSVPMDELEGLGARGDRWTANGVPVQRQRDAGSVDFTGDFTDGGGTAGGSSGPTWTSLRRCGRHT